MAKKTKKTKQKTSMRVNTINAKRNRLHAIQDNRLFTPLPLIQREIRSIDLTPVKIKNTPVLKKYGPAYIQTLPKTALICARRKIRKEVIFAKNKQGGQNKKPKYNANSAINCKG